MRSASLVGWAALAALILASAVLAPTVTHSNPIPSPTIVLKHEYIWVTFRQGPGADGITVTVTGIYPFRNVGFKELDMYFPVPPEVIRDGEAWVAVNGHQVKYEVVGEGNITVSGGEAKPFKYDSVLGVLPMLKWHVKLDGGLKDFTVNVTYRYVLRPVEIEVPCNCSPSGKVGVFVYRTIYAMATGRFYYVYSKRVVADVTLKFIGPKFNYAKVNVSLMPSPQEVSEGYTKVTLAPRDGEVIKFTIASDLFKGMRRDMLFKIWGYPLSMPTTTKPQACATTVTVTTTAAQSTTTVTLTKTVTVATMVTAINESTESATHATNHDTTTTSNISTQNNAQRHSPSTATPLMIGVGIALIAAIITSIYLLRKR